MVRPARLIIVRRGRSRRVTRTITSRRERVVSASNGSRLIIFDFERNGATPSPMMIIIIIIRGSCCAPCVMMLRYYPRRIMTRKRCWGDSVYSRGRVAAAVGVGRRDVTVVITTCGPGRVLVAARVRAPKTSPPPLTVCSLSLARAVFSLPRNLISMFFPVFFFLSTTITRTPS